MTITERTLRNWRKDALKQMQNPLFEIDPNKDPERYSIAILREKEYCQRVLRLTQELLDAHLMKGK